ncbi:MAG: branched-chain amino acid ABC transporter permease [Alphaproteobacteria bacterium]|nr:branched-chain amino acid ABC transporter permease [Alphaproteobacteria bacterium]
MHLVHFIVAAAILGSALAFVAWYAWREYVARGGGAIERRRILLLAAGGALIGGVVAGAYGKGSWPLWLALPATAAIMGVLAYAIERLVLRHLVNQEGIILFMATLGIAYFLDGFGQTLWGSDIYKINLGLPKDPIFLLEGVFEGGLLVDPGDLVAAVIAAVLVVVLAVFFQKTRVGRALRAVADDHAAAQSVGIPLDTIWLIVWTVSGLVALAAGVIWGAKLGVQFSISLIALKALPVLILGGFTSVPGAIIGGLIIGAGEKLSEVFLAPILVKQFNLAGGGIENWFAYVLALIFLLFRPQGLFGERIIERV